MKAIINETVAVNTAGSAFVSTCFSESVEKVLRIEALMARKIDDMNSYYIVNTVGAIVLFSNSS